MSVTRKFRGSDSAMLISISALATAAIQHKTFLATERATWAGTFLDDLLADINTTISTNLGVDNAIQLRAKTDLVEAARIVSYGHLTRINNQIDRDFRPDPSRRDELYKILGYKDHWSSTRKKNQEKSIELMFTFKQNLTPEIKAELVAKGISATRIDGVVAQAQTLLNANITQEVAKKLVPTLNEATIKAYNEIYARAMDVAIISRQLFAGQAAIQDQFSYTKTLAALGGNALTTKYDQIQIIQPGTLFTVPSKLTKKSRIFLTLLYNLDGVYACRNTDGCYPSDSRKLQFEVTIELTKADLQGAGDYLIISNPLAENAKVQIKIQG